MLAYYPLGYGVMTATNMLNERGIYLNRVKCVSWKILSPVGVQNKITLKYVSDIEPYV